MLKLVRNKIIIRTEFPSASKVAKDLGVSKKVARDLSVLAKRSLETGEYALPGVRPLVTNRRAHKVAKPQAGRTAADAATSTKK